MPVQQEEAVTAPEGATSGSYTVTKSTGCYNYVGESSMYFFTESAGQFVFTVTDNDLKAQIWAAFENPTQFTCYVFHTGATVIAIQVRADV